MNRISFIVPVYNVGNYIGQCIESLVSQQYKDLEIILVDDGSTDNSVDICLAYQEKDARIRLLRQKNRGANAARNLGLKCATGKWVCFVDGDDWVSAGMCSELSTYIQGSWNIIIYSYNKVQGKRTRALSSCVERYEFHKEDFQNLQLSALNRFRDSEFNYKMLDAVSIWNKFYNREFLQAYGLEFVPGMPKLQDLTFNLMVYEHAVSAVYVHKHLYNYRINRESVSHRFQEDIIAKFEVINRYLWNFVEPQNDVEYTRAYHERIATHLRTIVVLYLCNSQNRTRYAGRKKEFIQLLEMEPYKSAVEKASMAGLPVKEHILSAVIRHRCFAVCCILCFLLETLNRVKG